MNIWLLVLFLIELIWVSWVDIKIKKISNQWFFAHAVVFGLLHFWQPLSYPFSTQTFLFPCGFLVIGFALFWVGIMGAGDSKFLASFFLLIPQSLHLLFFQKLVYSTFVVGFVMLSFKIARDFKVIKAYALSSYWIGVVTSIRSQFSYAPVILLGWLLFGREVWK